MSYKGNIIKKDPQAELSYGISWANWIPASDSISTAEWTLPAGITSLAESLNTVPMVIDGETHAIGTVALIKLSGGTAGTDYTLACRVTLASGEVDERSIVIACRER